MISLIKSLLLRLLWLVFSYVVTFNIVLNFEERYALLFTFSILILDQLVVESIVIEKVVIFPIIFRVITATVHVHIIVSEEVVHCLYGS